MEMDYDGVRTLAAAADRVAAELPGRSHSPWSATGRAAAGSRGLASAAALDRCELAWSARLRDLAEQVVRIGDDLRTSANEYQAADEASAHGFGRIGADL